MLIDRHNFYLIVVRKSIDEREYDAPSTVINDLIDVWGRKSSLGQALFKSKKLIQTLIVPYFLAIGTILDTQLVNSTG